MEHSILIVEDDATLASNIQTYLERKHYEVLVCSSAEEALAMLGTHRPDVLLTDRSLPGMSGLELIARVRALDPQIKPIVMTGYGNVEDAVAAMKAGSYHYLTKPVVLAELKLLIDKALEAQRLEHALSFYQAREARDAGLDALIGSSPAMLAMKATVHQLLEAESRMTDADLPVVLIQGETGTGKELVARACHAVSARRNAPFLALNCAALPENLAESELFGYAPGAFTGAQRGGKPGLLELAHQGTVFLDEIGEMSPYLQAKLLRFLSDGSFRRIGGEREIKVDVRILSATHRNLEQMVGEGRFREDLFYRLNVLNLAVPPLRERSEDILPLARHFLQQACAQIRRPPCRLAPDTYPALLANRWPGNVRQLQNVIFRAAAISEGSLVEIGDLDIAGTAVAPRADEIGSLGAAVENFERGILERLYASYPSSRLLAARLQTSHTAIAKRLRKYGIPGSER